MEVLMADKLTDDAVTFKAQVQWETPDSATLDKDMAEIMVQTSLNSLYGMIGAAAIDYEFTDFDSISHVMTFQCPMK